METWYFVSCKKKKSTPCMIYRILSFAWGKKSSYAWLFIFLQKEKTIKCYGQCEGRLHFIFSSGIRWFQCLLIGNKEWNDIPILNPIPQIYGISFLRKKDGIVILCSCGTGFHIFFLKCLNLIYKNDENYPSIFVKYLHSPSELFPLAIIWLIF